MKRKILARALVLLVAVTVLGSCDLLFGLFNNITVDGERFDLTNLYVSDLAQFDTGKYVMMMIFTSDGVSFTGSGGFTGSGEALMLYTVVPSRMAEGTYNYTQSDPPPVPAVVGGMAIVGGTYSGWNEPAWQNAYGVVGGSMAVRETLTDGYVIEFDLTGEEVDSFAAAAIEGRFRGKITGDFLLADVFGGAASVDAMRSLFN